MRYFFWLFLISLVIFRYFTTRPVYKDGQKIRITSIVLEEPTRYKLYQKIDLSGLTIFLPNFPEITYGDRVKVVGKANRGKLENAKLINITTKENVFVLREKILEFYKESLPEPSNGLLAGIVLGSKSSLTNDFWQKLRNTGTLHVVVASGMNVTLVAESLIRVLTLFFKRKTVIPFTIFGIWIYALISGFDAPIVRAALMACLAFSAQELGRLANAWNLLFLSGLIMLIIVPSWISDIGFTLSFVATASLMLFQKRIEKNFVWLPTILKEGPTTSLAAQIGVAPILFVTFGQFNPASPIINAAVLWTIPGIMIIGMVGGILGLFLPDIGKLILYLSYPLTWWFSFIVTTFG